MIKRLIKRFQKNKEEDLELSAFEIWKSKKKDKIDYPFLLGIDNKIIVLLREHMHYELINKYKVLDLDYFIRALDVLEEIGKITKEYKKECLLELMELNFGSMTLNW